MKKSIIIIGAGMGGLSAGIYARRNGYETTIFEQHYLPGGQCASYKRKGYTFDVCIHHLFGTEPGSRLYGLWEELGAMPRTLAATNEAVAACSPEGRMYFDYWDSKRLEEHIKELSPADSELAVEYARAIRDFSSADFMGALLMGDYLDVPKMIPRILRHRGLLKLTMQDFGLRFKDEFLKKAFPLLEYSLPEVQLIIHLAKHGYGLTGNIAWPVGASIEFARSIEKTYLDLGGEVHYRQKVSEILTEGGRAVGVRLEDGSEHRADVVISDADGRKTIMDMLGGRFTNEKVRRMCGPPDDEMNWAVHVFLGVDRDLSGEPSALVQLLEEPVDIAAHEAASIEMQMYPFDPTMAPEGKGVIKVELWSRYSYWKELYADRNRYDEEKQKVADTVIDLLENTHFPGIRSQVEVIDVPTLLTWERYTGITWGLGMMPAVQPRMVDAFLGKGYMTLPGLDSFYMVGAFATYGPSLFHNAISGRKTVRALCKRDGRRFIAA